MAWILIRVGETNSGIVGHKEWQLDEAADIENPPSEAQEAAPGSLAWTGDYTHLYNKANNGTWLDIMSHE